MARRTGGLRADVICNKSRVGEKEIIIDGFRAFKACLKVSKFGESRPEYLACTEYQWLRKNKQWEVPLSCFEGGEDILHFTPNER